MVIFKLRMFYKKLKPQENGCILYTAKRKTGKKTNYRHITIKYPDIKIDAHVLAFILHYKREPLGDVHHICGIKSCVNPLHLEEHPRSEHMRLHRLESNDDRPHLR